MVNVLDKSLAHENRKKHNNIEAWKWVGNINIHSLSHSDIRRISIICLVAELKQCIDFIFLSSAFGVRWMECNIFARCNLIGENVRFDHQININTHIFNNEMNRRHDALAIPNWMWHTGILVKHLVYSWKCPNNTSDMQAAITCAAIFFRHHI